MKKEVKKLIRKRCKLSVFVKYRSALPSCRQQRMCYASDSDSGRPRCCELETSSWREPDYELFRAYKSKHRREGVFDFQSCVVKAR